MIDICTRDFNPSEEESAGYIQWKGTDVCMDLYCVCGAHDHIDAEFFYRYKCRKCDRHFMVGRTIKLIELAPDEIEEDVDYFSGDLPIEEL